MTAAKPPPQEMWAAVLKDGTMLLRKTVGALAADSIANDLGVGVWEWLRDSGRVRFFRVRVEVIDE